MERTEQMTQASAPASDVNRSYIDWPAIFGGAVVATALGGLFAAFGAGLGLSTLSAEPSEGSVYLSIVLTAIWMVVTVVATYALGGYIAGRMRRRVDEATADEVTVRDGINGLIVWGVAMIVGAMLVANFVANTVSAAGSVAGSVAQTAGSVVGEMAQGALGTAGAASSDSQMTFAADTLLRPVSSSTVGSTPAEDARQAVGIIANIARTGEISDADQTYLVNLVEARSGLTPAEAGDRVAGAVEAAKAARADAMRVAEETKQAAIDAAETARISAVLTGFLVAAGSLIAAAAAYVGAVVGGRHRDEGRVFSGLGYRV